MVQTPQPDLSCISLLQIMFYHWSRVIVKPHLLMHSIYSRAWQKCWAELVVLHYSSIKLSSWKKNNQGFLSFFIFHFQDRSRPSTAMAACFFFLFFFFACVFVWIVLFPAMKAPKRGSDLIIWWTLSAGRSVTQPTCFSFSEWNEIAWQCALETRCILRHV